MGDPRRFDLFARFVANLIEPSRRANMRVADVATGRGSLSWALREHGFQQITPFEPVPRRGGQVRRLGIRVQDFEPSFARDFDLVIGMHPDAATDCILSGCALHGALAVVCPCCVRPNAWSYRGNQRSRREWEKHLLRKSADYGLNISTTTLPMSGANTVMWGVGA